MHMCEKTTPSKSATSGGLKTGITCHTCGGIGHYSRNCSSKAKSTAANVPIKVNMAVAKITTREEYKKFLPETKKQVGNCQACNQPPHNYSRTFPFGKAEWPSNRLDSCPKFMAMTTKERGELLERIQGCYKCTSSKHLGDNCFIKSKTNCNVTTQGVACGGAHYKLLHGTGVAFATKYGLSWIRFKLMV